MKRRNFLRDIALGIAATLVPRILQPVIPEVKNVFSLDALIACVDEYQLATYKMQAIARRSIPSGVQLFWQNEEWLAIRTHRSKVMTEIHELILN